MISLNLLAFLLFVSTYLIGQKIGWHWSQIVPGAFMLYFLPGYNLNLILFRNRKLAWHTKFSLDLISSISLLSLVYLTFRSHIELRSQPLYLLVLITNLLVAIPSVALVIKQKEYGPKLNVALFAKLFKQNSKILFILAIPLLLFAIRLILNPYVFDIDSLVYFDAFQKISILGNSSGPLFSGREAFPFFMMSTHYLAGLNYIGFFKFFIPLLFIFSASILFSLQTSKKGLSWIYLLILASPMLTIANENVRPETFSLAFTLPVLVLCFSSLKSNDWLFGVLALVYSLVAFRFHESGFILLFSSLLTIFILIIQNRKIFFRFIKNHLLLSIFIILPYLLLLTLNLNTLSEFGKDGMTDWFLSIIRSSLSSVHWDWWFIDDCTTAMGAKIGWPGLSAVLYYLYDGITLFLLTLILLIIYLKGRNQQSKPIAWIQLLPVVIFLCLHFAYAEILPRMGIILLPNRSWPYIMLALVPLAIVLFERISLNYKAGKALALLTVATIVSGIIGSIIGSTFMGAMVLPQEKTAINAIKSLPSDAIVVSTQRDNNLVRIYGSRDFLQITSDNFQAKTFAYAVKKKIADTAEDKNIETLGGITLAKVKNEEKILIGSKIVSNDSRIEPITAYDEKINLLRQYDPETYEEISKILLDSSELLKSKKIYFLYSFAKLDHGIISTRPWWRESNDQKNYQFFKKYTGDDITAKDQNFILIRIN